MAPTSSTTTSKAKPDTAVDAPQTDTADTTQGERETPKPSTRSASPGDVLLYEGPRGPELALVLAGGAGEAEVLCLADGNLPKARSVVVYDSAEELHRAGGEHVAHWPAA